VRHPHHRSGNSSQTLALGLLGTAAWRDRSLEWWWESLDLPGPTGMTPRFIYDCAAYWKTAAELFMLPKHDFGEEPCRLGRIPGGA
jgi:hypothetical protein